MLFGQLSPKTCEKISAELGFNFGVVSGKLSSQLPASEMLTSRLEIVCQAIEAERETGSTSETHRWVRDQLTCRPIVIPENQDLFLLAGVDVSAPLLLAGSAVNIITGVPAEHVQLGYSYLPYLAKTLWAWIDRTERSIEDDEIWSGQNPPGIRNHELADVIDWSVREATGPGMVVDYVGMRLFAGKSLSGSLCQLVSPICCALVT